MTSNTFINPWYYFDCCLHNKHCLLSHFTSSCGIHFYFLVGSQWQKVKKSIPDISFPNLQEIPSLSQGRWLLSNGCPKILIEEGDRRHPNPSMYVILIQLHWTDELFGHDQTAILIKPQQVHRFINDVISWLRVLLHPRLQKHSVQVLNQSTVRNQPVRLPECLLQPLNNN